MRGTFNWLWNCFNHMADANLRRYIFQAFPTVLVSDSQPHTHTWTICNRKAMYVPPNKACPHPEVSCMNCCSYCLCVIGVLSASRGVPVSDPHLPRPTNSVV